MEMEELNEWNPWWEKKETIQEFVGAERPFYSYLIDAIEIKEVVIITGVRRSGKSTLMYQMINKLLSNGVEPKQILFINFEDKKITESSLDDLYFTYRKTLNPEKKAYIFLDEIHKRKGWESWVRKKYDLKTKDKFVISGSCSYLLKKEYSTLLTGRNVTFEVFPLSFEEFLTFKGITIDKNLLKKRIILEQTKIQIEKSFDEYLNIGGFPEIFFKEELFKIKVLEQYFDDILYKDIIDRYILNTQKTKDLALFLLTNFTGFISLRNIRKSLKISYDTIKDYISYFKEAYLFFTVDHFSYSFKEQKTKAAKVYCIDNGLRNAAAFKFSKDTGKLAENLILVELKRRGKDVYYWKNKGEVDFIIKEKDQSIHGINVSYTDLISAREKEALQEFQQTYKKTKQLILITKDIEKEEAGIKYIPLWKWLLLEE